MNNYYQIDLPTGMTPVHPDHHSTVNPSLAALLAGRVFVSGTSHIIDTFKVQNTSSPDASDHDISQFNPATNQKKEVCDIKDDLQHCKSIQYNMKWSSGPDFFNKIVFIY